MHPDAKRKEGKSHFLISNKKKRKIFDFKQSLESVFMSDIADWKKEELIENQISMRTKKLKAA